MCVYQHYQGNIMRPWLQILAVFLSQCWHLPPTPTPTPTPNPHPPIHLLLIDLCTLHSASSQSFFFHQSSKHFAFNTNILFMEKQLIWVFESRKSVHYEWSYISFAPECKDLPCMLRPSIIQVGCPTCCYQVCALDHAKGGAADLDYPSEPCHRNEH